MKASQDVEAASLDSACINVVNWSTDGGQAIGYFEPNGELAAAHCKLFGETGSSLHSFYFDHGELFFASMIDHTYNRPYYWDDSLRNENGDTEVFDMAKTNTTATAYFFEKGKLLCFGSMQHASSEAAITTEGDTSVFSGSLLLKSMFLDTRKDSAVNCEAVPWRAEFKSYLPPCEMTSPDTSLANVGLEDAPSSIASLGKIPSEDLIEDDQEFPHVNMVSSNGTQFLSFFFYYGDGADQFAAMRLSRTRSTAIRDTLPDAAFRSGKGVSLGMSKADVIAKLGECYSIYNGVSGHELLSYSIKDLVHSEFLHLYNMPSYYACLEFEHDKLIDYRFGFDYP